MKKDIILAGVGGQGILTIAAAIGYAALDAGLHLKQAEVHGMSQRGGDVQSHVRISSNPIASDLIPQGKADMILSIEPMESLRYLPMLSSDGWLITSSNPVQNIKDYPPLEEILSEIWKQPKQLTIDADMIAKELGSVKAANMVVLGAAADYLDLSWDLLQAAMVKLFGRKGEDLVLLNQKALEAGRNYARSHLK